MGTLLLTVSIFCTVFLFTNFVHANVVDVVYTGNNSYGIPGLKDGYRYRQYRENNTLITVVYSSDQTLLFCEISQVDDHYFGFFPTPPRERTSATEFTVNLAEIISECKRLERNNGSGYNSGEGEREEDDDDDDHGSSPFAVVAPGTNYCGAGNRGGELGRLEKADACCREHDFCPYSIPARSTKYELKNNRPYTVSWYDCDLRFKICLKMADTMSANVIGVTYFNVLSPPSILLSDVPPSDDTTACYSKHKLRY